MEDKKESIPRFSIEEIASTLKTREHSGYRTRLNRNRGVGGIDLRILYLGAFVGQKDEAILLGSVPLRCTQLTCKQ